ncbi:hypothetical protein HPHPP30_1581 [Helicobacter pylori Hp P-30]|nr:hypothetical protein HPHPP30_1581 [Helicobacter pylori Hp P-30]
MIKSDYFALSASKFLYLEKQPKIFIKCCQILRLSPKNALMVK